MKITSIFNMAHRYLICIVRAEVKVLVILVKACGVKTLSTSEKINWIYMDAVVSRFGLKAESSLRVRIDGLPGGLVRVLVFQSHFIASLLLHALGQAADGDLSADAEAVENPHQNPNKKQAWRKTEEDHSEWKYRWNSRHVAPCCDDVRKLGGAGGNLHCDRLEEHELLVHADGVGASCHVLQPERTVFFGGYCEEQNRAVRHAVDGPWNHCLDAGVLPSTSCYL